MGSSGNVFDLYLGDSWTESLLECFILTEGHVPDRCQGSSST